MKLFLIILAAAAGLCALFFLLLWIFYLIAFRGFPDAPDLPGARMYKPYLGRMQGWIDELGTIPCQEVYITSFDGLKLHGRYFEYAPGAPLEILFHGYRGTAIRDLCGGVHRCFALGHSALLVDQRTAGESEGRTITFGIRESRDCAAWAHYAARRFGPEVRIILTGISMGAATVLMAPARDLPPNAVGILADCGYTSPKEIIQKVMKQIHFPVRPLYPLVRLSARLFGGFDPEELSPLEVMEHCSIPVLFVHGEGDDFVPCDMSRRNFEICTAPKRLFTVPEAGHGMAYLVDENGYLNALRAFAPTWGLES